jgi:putative PIN family toxin of toxin-antitoxin system
LRAVLDTNVLISALLFPGGSPESVLRLVFEERLETATSVALLTELKGVLGRKFGWDDGRIQAAIRPLLQVASVVDPSETVTDISVDPADNRVLEAAAAADAETIISGDRHLLSLRQWRQVRILTPGEFLAAWASTGTPPGPRGS